MAKYILDTDICIYWLNGDQAIEEKILQSELENIYMTVITECELFYGAYKSAKTKKNLELLSLLKKNITTLQTTPEVSSYYGKTKTLLERAGQVLDDADLLIACITMACKGILVTNNTRHFKRISGLVCENWKRP